MKRPKELSREIPGAYVPGQFDNPVNAEAHRKTTGDRRSGTIRTDRWIFLWREWEPAVRLPEWESICKEKNPGVKVVAMEPAGSPVLSGGKPGPHKIQGIGAGFVPKVLNTSIWDEIVAVEDEEAIEGAKLIAKKEGVLVGISSGAALAAAIRLAKRPENEGKMIVALLPDSGDRYYSTPLFTE